MTALVRSSTLAIVFVCAAACKEEDPAAGELREQAERAVSAFDRQIKATCECFVATGRVESEAVCIEMYASDPEWVPCAAEVLAENDSAETREQVACFGASTEKQADCVENAACDNDKLAACTTVPAQCADEILPVLLERCPKLGLLSR
jgi:hypothetical protein